MVARCIKSALAFALLVTTAMQAQVRGVQPANPAPSAGLITLQVQVLTDGQAEIDEQALLRLRSVQMDERWETTHLGSQAAIAGLSRGDYTLEVSAVGFQTSVQNVELRTPFQAVQVVLQREKKKTDFAPSDMSGISHKARELCAKGIGALQSGNTKEAEKDFRNALKKAENSGQVHYLVGIALLQQKRVPEAAQFFEKAIALDPVHVQALTALAGLRFESKDYAAAASLLDRAIAVNDRLWRPRWLLANVYLEQQAYEKARENAEQAVTLSGHSAPYASLALGEALNGLGQYQEAADAFKDFLQNAPTSPDAPEVRRMMATLIGRQDRPPEKARPESLTLAVLSLPLQTSPVLSSVAPTWGPADIDAVSPPVVRGTTCPTARVLAGITSNIAELVDSLDRFSALRTQVHEQLNLMGNPISKQSRKGRYLAEISQKNPGSIELNEYSQDLSGLGAFSDGIRIHGMLGLALIFHPSLQGSYQMDCEGLGEWKGQPAWLVHFRQRPDRPLLLQSFRAGGQTFSLALKGRAWVAASRFRILHIEADLVSPVKEIDLRSEHQIADYGPVALKKNRGELWLPKDTQTYLDYAGRHYLFSDHFDDFVLFTVDTHPDPKGRDSN